MILSLVSELLARVGRRPVVEEAVDTLRRSGGFVRLDGLTDPAKALVAPVAATKLRRPAILIVDSNQRAEVLVEPLRWFYRAVTGKPGHRVVHLPALEVLPYDRRSPHAEISEDRAVALWRLANGDADVMIAPVQAALWRMRESEFYRHLARTIERDQDIPHRELLDFLSSAGYDKQTTCEMPGQFAVSGGIIDVFSPEAPQPVRIELLGDTIESIRAFDPNTQRSTNPMERATLLPLTEFPRRAEVLQRLRVPAASGREDDEAPPGFYPGWEFQEILLEDRKSSLFDLAGDTLIIEDEPSLLKAAVEQYRDNLRESFEAFESPVSQPPNRFIFDEEEWSLAMQLAPRLGVEHLGVAAEDTPQRTLQTQPTTRYHGNVAAFMSEVREKLSTGEQVMVSAATNGELERLADICHEYEVPYRLGELEESVTVSRLAEESHGGNVPGMILIKAPVSEGVVIPEVNLTIYGNTDLFETLPPPSQRARSRPKSASFFSDFSDLKPGDFVVHVDHGIGQFDGLRQVAVEGANGEFMLLHYAEDAKLYVPLARLDLIQKYNALGGATPALDRLGTTIWEARKTRVRKSVSDMAEKLLELYAERKMATGHAFPPDSNWQREFEDAFEFEETADQQKAIDDVKRDMESTLPMDRLLCGDVGYGKTEVAMRAAFKAIADSKQAAILAPTTVLAFQHYETFRRRFAAFPVRIEMLSRFRSEKEQKKVLEEVEQGKVDIVIGTHRLLSKDVKFQDLGLLVVDEEQRFGVAHKERLKEMRKNVHALALSATPIPRTLHMSLVGLRDMSVIETPPRDRLAIQTVVAPFTEQMVKKAIETELAREGQVSFIHNRVESIYPVASLVSKLVPKARVVVGHGQMNEKELEKVMLKFIRDEADVLVATTIVENGLDIPRANTILINRADRLGLAELYQLRGRVGRSHHRAYAYLLVPPERILSDVARKRLAAMKEFSELGAGFRIAALDLELRGAGNLLGRQQHGHIEAVGFDMYTQMLEGAVAKLKGEESMPELRTTLSLGMDVRIPQEYIPSENLRLRTYKRISSIATEAEKQDVHKELEDRFGAMPKSVENLLEYAMLKSISEKLRIASVERQGMRIALRFHPETQLDPAAVVKVVRSRKGIKLDPSGVLWMELQRGESVPGALRNVLLGLRGEG